jgi:hypothetical protein
MGNALYAVSVVLQATMLITLECGTAPLAGLKKRILIILTWRK